MEELRIDNQRLCDEVEKAKKILERNQSHISHVEQKHAHAIHKLQENISNAEGHAIALKDDVTNNEKQLLLVRSQLKKVSLEKQELLEQNLTLTEKLSVYESAAAGDMRCLERQLRQEMSAAVLELEGLVQICSDRAEGQQDPRLSLLLGVRHKNIVVEQSEETCSEDSIAALKLNLNKIQDMRYKVDKIREIISNKYAEDLGEQLDPQCATQ